MTTASPAFSVVIPAYEAETTILSTLRSVVRQTFGDFEVIVADDGSTDDTPAVTRSVGDPRIRVLELEHVGAGAARNAGFSASRGRYISFLDADDLWLPRFLEVMHETLEEHPTAGFCYTMALGFDDRTRRVAPRPVMAAQGASAVPPADPEQFYARLLHGNFVYTSTCIPRAVLEQVGGFDGSLRAGIDYELWLRIAAHGFAGIRAPGILAMYRAQRPGSITSNRRRVASGLVDVYTRAVASHPASAANLRLAASMLAEAQRDLAAVDGKRSLDAILRRSRWRLSSFVHGILGTDARGPAPRELAEAFPDIFGEGAEPRAG